MHKVQEGHFNFTAQKDDHPWYQNYGPGTRTQIAPLEYLNLADMVQKTSKNWAHNKAFSVVLPNGITGSLTFKETDELSDNFAVYLREEAGLKQGDRVAIQLPNCLGYPTAAFGILKAGGVIVNTNPLYTEFEMNHQFADSGAKILVIIDLFANKIEEAIKNTQIEKIILISIADLFPKPKQTFLKFMLKYVKKHIPQCSVPHTTLNKVLKIGEQLKKAKSIEVESYWSKIHLDDLCALQYTGGTTGVSKGAMLTHGNIMSNMYQIYEVGKSKIDMGNETILTALPMYHIFAFSLNLLTFYNSGGHNILIPSPRPLANVKHAILNYPITWISGVNTLFNGLLHENWFIKNPPKNLKMAISGGTALHDSVAQHWLKTAHSLIAEGYGLTETSPVVTFNPVNGRMKADTVGIPVPSTEVVMLDENNNPVPIGTAGEIAVKGPQVMKGYWQRHKETNSVFHNGWLLTGDIGVMDEDGYIKIVDRKKDLIIVSGFNVYPNEVEDCLAAFEGVQEVAVVGVPSEQTGECVKAFIVKKATANFTEAELIEHSKKFLTHYKIPKMFEFRTELPKSPVGKILRKDLRPTKDTGAQKNARNSEKSG